MGQYSKTNADRVYLQGLTTGGHTWAHRGVLPVSCQWFGSGPVSGLREKGHRAHRRSEEERGKCVRMTTYTTRFNVQKDELNQPPAHRASTYFWSAILVIASQMTCGRVRRANFYRQAFLYSPD